MILVIVNIDIEGFHYWKEATANVGFLKNNHRHIFKIIAEVEVDHFDREIEFFTFGKILKNYLDVEFGTPCDFKGLSCENIALLLKDAFALHSCTVLEDGLNGAKITD